MKATMVDEIEGAPRGDGPCVTVIVETKVRLVSLRRVERQLPPRTHRRSAVTRLTDDDCGKLWYVLPPDIDDMIMIMMARPASDANITAMGVMVQ